MAFKDLIDRMRGKPEWQHPDPAVRAEAVLRIPSAEADLLKTILREDLEARVRRAAVKKLSDATVLAGVAQDDADAGVREEAAAHLMTLAVHAPDEAAAEAVLALVQDPRHLAEVARAAPRESTRFHAVSRLKDPKLLATVVRECQDTATRLAALARIDDPALLAGFAHKSDVKAIALAAVERVVDPAALQTIARRARVGAAGKRAQALLSDARPGPAPAPVAVTLPAPGPDADATEREAYERERARLAQEAREREEGVRARAGICEALEGASAADLLGAIETARASWAGLPPLAGAEAEASRRRFESATAAATSRHQAYVAAEARRGELDTLVTQMEALVETADLEAGLAAFEPLRAQWNERAREGAPPDDLRARFDAAAFRLEARRFETQKAAAERARDNLHRLAALAARLEGLARAASLTLRDADRAVRDARAAVESPGPLPTKRDRDAVMARIEAARKALFPRLKDLREEAEWKHFANVDVQEELCRRAEALREAQDLEKAAEQLRDLDARWKQAREAPKDQAEALWTRFKAARDEVRARCDAYFAKKAEELARNLAQKEALCAQAEGLAESSEWLKTAEALKKLQAEWKEVGPVHHSKAKPVWDRFRKACDRFFSRRDEDRAKRREDSARNLERKHALSEKAEALAESSDWEASSAEIKKLQSEWKQIGPVRGSQSEAVWQRFRAACDRFFDRYKHKDQLAEEAAVSAREALCAEIEGMSPETIEGLGDKVVQAQAAWRQAPAVSREKAEPLHARFAAAVARLVAAEPAAFAGTDLDPEATRKKMEKLCLRVEAALASAAPDGLAPAAQDLATRLKDALAANTIGGHAAVEARWREATGEVEAARAAWQRLTPASGPLADELRARFERASSAFFEARPPLSEPRAPERRDRGPRPERRPRPPRDREAHPRR